MKKRTSGAVVRKLSLVSKEKLRTLSHDLLKLANGGGPGVPNTGYTREGGGCAM